MKQQVQSRQRRSKDRYRAITTDDEQSEGEEDQPVQEESMCSLMEEMLGKFQQLKSQSKGNF